MIVASPAAGAVISTHAPLRGATDATPGDILLNKNFYSRASARRDEASDFMNPATEFLLTRLCEARHTRKKAKFIVKKFLLTRLCEARHIPCTHQCFSCNFYSRASARRDNLSPISSTLSLISTHAPLRGATESGEKKKEEVLILLTRLCEARPGRYSCEPGS